MKEENKKLTKENARIINVVIDATEDGTMTILDNDLDNIATLVIHNNDVLQ